MWSEAIGSENQTRRTFPSRGRAMCLTQPSLHPLPRFCTFMCSQVPPLLLAIHAFNNLIVIVGLEVSYGLELVPFCIATIKCEFDCH